MDNLGIPKPPSFIPLENHEQGTFHKRLFKKSDTFLIDSMLSQ